MSKICPNCGKENADNYMFCMGCGTRFEDSSIEISNEAPKGIEIPSSPSFDSVYEKAESMPVNPAMEIPAAPSFSEAVDIPKEFTDPVPVAPEVPDTEQAVFTPLQLNPTENGYQASTQSFANMPAQPQTPKFDPVTGQPVNLQYTQQPNYGQPVQPQYTQPSYGQPAYNANSAYPMQPQYAPVPASAPENEVSKGLSVTATILGVLGLVLSLIGAACYGVFGAGAAVVLSIVGLILGINVKKKSNNKKGGGAFVCSLIGIILGIIMMAACGLLGYMTCGYGCYGCLGAQYAPTPDLDDYGYWGDYFDDDDFYSYYGGSSFSSDDINELLEELEGFQGMEEFQELEDLMNMYGFDIDG